MYETKIIGQGLYRAVSQGYGQPIETFGKTEDGETPMSLVNLALASCVTMCAQGYFKTSRGLDDFPVDVTASYTGEGFRLLIHLREALASSDEKALLDYVDQKCRVKQLLRPDLPVKISVA